MKFKKERFTIQVGDSWYNRYEVHKGTIMRKVVNQFRHQHGASISDKDYDATVGEYGIGSDSRLRIQFDPLQPDGTLLSGPLTHYNIYLVDIYYYNIYYDRR